MSRAAWILVLVAAACGRDKIEVQRSSNDEYKHDALVGAIDKFVKANRTPDAYAELAQTVTTLRPHMDRTVGKQAELRMVVLALAPVQSVQARSIRERVDALALTVWPTLLGPPIAADALLVVRDPRAPDYVPKPGEDPDPYMMRLCEGALARHCKRVVPELQGEIIEALAIRRATERARNAVSECLECENDPGWKQAVHTWEGLDRVATERVPDIERRADPDN